MTKRFEGVIPPHITPFTRNDEIDTGTLRELVDYWINSGLHGLIPGGSTGEGPSMLHEERKRLMDIVIDQANGRVPVIPGTACNGTKETILLSKYAQDAGADGVMIVHPFYSIVDESELYEHYRAIANAIDIPIILYNNPFTSKIDMKPSLVVKLARDGYISYVKECSGYLQRVPEIIRLSEDKVTVFIGVDDTHLEAFALGAQGWIAGIANFLPHECVELFNAAVKEKNFDKAVEINRKIRPIGELTEQSGKFVQYCKYGVELVRGKPVGPPRMPLQPLSEEERSRYRALVTAAGRSARA